MSLLHENFNSAFFVHLIFLLAILFDFFMKPFGCDAFHRIICILGMLNIHAPTWGAYYNIYGSHIY